MEVTACQTKGTHTRYLPAHRLTGRLPYSEASAESSAVDKPPRRQDSTRRIWDLKRLWPSLKCPFHYSDSSTTNCNRGWLRTKGINPCKPSKRHIRAAHAPYMLLYYYKYYYCVVYIHARTQSRADALLADAQGEKNRHLTVSPAAARRLPTFISLAPPNNPGCIIVIVPATLAILAICRAPFSTISPDQQPSRDRVPLSLYRT